jgi:hypothetical protein
MRFSVFLAHKKKEACTSVDTMVAALKSDIDRMADVDSKVTAGRDDYTTHARSLGGWAAWQRDVATGTTIEGHARFDVLVSPDRAVGRATAQMLLMAGNAGKDIYYWDGKALQPIREVVEVDTEDWASGWALRA